MDKAIIVDLDGTLTNVDHRVSHVKKDPKDWKAFNAGMIHDELYFWCAELISAMRNKDYKILFVTGRSETSRIDTENWLKKHNIMYDLLFMRKSGDRREDCDVKEEIYLTQIRDQFSILFVVDDRKSVVDRWRKLDLICLQCAEGNF